jgi:hypothetical protein
LAKAADVLGLRIYRQWSGGTRLQGKIGAYKFRITSTPSSELPDRPLREPIEYRLAFPSPLPLNLSLRNEDMITRFVRFLGYRDIEVGDAEFDQRIYVKSRAGAKVIDFLTEARREAVLDLAQSLDVFIVTIGSIYVIHDAPIRRAEQVTLVVERMIRLANALGEETKDEIRDRAASEAEQSARRAFEDRDGADADDEPEADDPESTERVDIVDAWIAGGEALPAWMKDQGIRLEDEAE